MIGRRIDWLVLSAAVLVAGGCAHRNAAVHDGEYAAEQAVLHVTNHNWHDMTIYLVSGTMRHRLGTVTSLMKRTFNLPGHMLAGAGNAQLVADPIGSSKTYRSPELIFAPGRVVEWRLENNLSLSSAFVR